MKKSIIVMLLALFVNCTNNQQAVDTHTNEDNKTTSSKKVSFEIGSKFFVKNNLDVKVFDKPYIDNEQEFNSVFGIVETMERHGNDEDTAIDFTKDIVVPIILEKTNMGTTIDVDSVLLNGNTLKIYCTVTEVQPITYIIQPNEVVILERKLFPDLANLKLEFEKTRKVL